MTKHASRDIASRTKNEKHGEKSELEHSTLVINRCFLPLNEITFGKSASEEKTERVEAEEARILAATVTKASLVLTKGSWQNNIVKALSRIITK